MKQERSGGSREEERETIKAKKREMSKARLREKR